MLQKGRHRRTDVKHIKDTFVWHGDITTSTPMDVTRVSYYTSLCGDDDKLSETANSIAKVEYDCSDDYLRTGQLVPRVFKKGQRGNRSRLVDIEIGIDVMLAALGCPVEAIMILSGDGDFLRLMREVARTGKLIWAGAFSSGLNPEIPRTVDRFLQLDEYFFSE
jgi:uncharacterized LabA/DUF88 family protein